MRHYQTDVLVIGGGATGTGILRDLSMRGFKCTLVERRDLAYGTTGRYHGLLHSGGRYVVKDPTAARECIEENRILRRIMPQCIEDTGGFFVLTGDDNPEYAPMFLEGCKDASVPVEEISIRQMLKAEPLLNPSIKRCFQVPDASADSFLAAELNTESARQYGASILLYHEVIDLLSEPESSISLNKVCGVRCHDLVKDEDVIIDASVVVNASGAWVGKIAELVGINLQMVPGKGTMVALNHRIVNTVINRCKSPSDGDILVPAHTVAVMGTTDIRVSDPDKYSIEPWEIRLMLDEGEKIIPGFKQFRILRAWAGVRPLVKDSNSIGDRDISRAFTLIDHSIRDGVDGLVTITGGKWTTYRKMAEVTANKVCEKLRTERECRTHLEMLPSRTTENTSLIYLGEQLNKIEKEKDYGQLICECELVSRTEVIHDIIQKNVITLDDLRRDTRLGMGPCQAAFCGFRAAGLLHQIKQTDVKETNVALRNFLQERWKGNLPVLWGQQLRQERFNEHIYINSLNINELPGAISSILAADNYVEADEVANPKESQSSNSTTKPKPSTFRKRSDVAVIGAGLAGLTVAWRAGLAGKLVHIISKGWGALYWSTGCIDVLGYKPSDYTERIENPLMFLTEFTKSNLTHPYSIVGIDLLNRAVISFLDMSNQYGYPYLGSLESNYILPTALGTIRPTCLVPMTMIAGDLHNQAPMLIVGFNKFLDFYPELIADNLNIQGFLAKSINLDLPTLLNQKFVSSMVIARLFDNPTFRNEVIHAIKPRLGNVERIGFPAVLGLDKSLEVIQHLESSLGVKVFEIPGLPPSIPGIRLQKLLTRVILNQHGVIDNGMQVNSAVIVDDSIESIWSEASARQIAHHARDYVLATGGILGGGITVDDDGYAKETVFNLPITIPEMRSNQFHNQFLSRQGHAIYQSGLDVDHSLRPISANGEPVFNNLYAAGSIIGNCDPVRELSMEGIALASGFKIAESIV